MKKEKVFAVIGSVLLALLIVASEIITAISPIVWGENKKVSAAVDPFGTVDGVWNFPDTLTLLEKYAGESYNTNDFTVFFGYEERMAFSGGVFSVHFESTQIRVQSGFGQFTTIFDASKPSAERWLSRDYKYWHIELKDDSLSDEVLALLNDLAGKVSDDVNDYHPFTPPAEPFEAYVSSIADTSVLPGVWFLKDSLTFSSPFTESVLFLPGYSASPAFTSFSFQKGELVYLSTVTSFPAYTSSGWTSSDYRLLFFPVGANASQTLAFLQSNAIKVSDQTAWNDTDLTWSGALPPDVSAGTQFSASDFDGIEPTSPAGTWLFYDPVNPRYFCSDINADYDFDFYVNFYYGYKFGRMYMEDMSSSGAGNFYLRYSVPVDRPVPSVNPIPAYLGIQTSATGWSRQQFRLIQIPQASSYPEGLIQFLRKNAIKLSDYASIDEGTPDPPTEYTVTYNVNGGSLSTGFLTETVTEGNHPVSPPTVVRNGYTFAGWSLSSSGSAVDLASYTVTSNVTFYALWVPVQTYIVTYDPQGADSTDMSLSEEVLSGSSPVDIPSCIKEGYEFLGWSLTPDGEVIDVSTYVVTSNVTFYARYEPLSSSSSITFDADGGTFSDGLDTYVISVSVGQVIPVDLRPDPPTRDGYIFDGWVTAQGGRINLDKFTPAVDSYTFYAHWVVDDPPVDPDPDPDPGDDGGLSNPLIFFITPIQTFLSYPIFGTLSIGDMMNVLLFVFIGLIFLKMFAGG